jgi:hypothetical protein
MNDTEFCKFSVCRLRSEGPGSVFGASLGQTAVCCVFLTIRAVLTGASSVTV